MRQTPMLIVAGASVRAAAQSALRAGFSPWAADLFADADLRACGPAETIAPYPAGLVEVLSRAPDAPWLYTGALENHPELVDACASLRPLWGNGGETLRAVRDPARLFPALRRAGWRTPDFGFSAAAAPIDGRWLRKPLRSAAGRRIAVWHGADAASPIDEECWFQEWIPGTPGGAVYVAADGRATLLGATEQLIGCAWAGGQGFWYGGSLGPWPLDGWRRELLAGIGATLAREFGLRGLFGVDFVETGDQIVPIEVNPRYTASLEILERARDLPALRLHEAACVSGRTPKEHDIPPTTDGWLGKAVLYALEPGQVDPDLAARLAARRHDSPGPCLADLPPAGTEFRPGDPLWTVFAAGPNRAATLDRLIAAAARWRAEARSATVPHSCPEGSR